MDDETDCELIIVPGVAFDEKLSRLGHGKGYYDNYISKYQSWALQKESRANMFKGSFPISLCNSYKQLT